MSSSNAKFEGDANLGKATSAAIGLSTPFSIFQVPAEMVPPGLTLDWLFTECETTGVVSINKLEIDGLQGLAIDNGDNDDSSSSFSYPLDVQQVILSRVTHQSPSIIDVRNIKNLRTLKASAPKMQILRNDYPALATAWSSTLFTFKGAGSQIDLLRVSNVHVLHLDSYCGRQKSALAKFYFVSQFTSSEVLVNSRSEKIQGSPATISNVSRFYVENVIIDEIQCKTATDFLPSASSRSNWNRFVERT